MNSKVKIASLGASRTASNHRVLVIESTTPNIDTTSTLDLTDNDLIIDYTGAAGTIPADVEALIRRGYNNGNWLGTGITSSTAAAAANHPYTLGVSHNADRTSPFSTFAGQSVDLTTVLVKFTHQSDVDLDDVVGINDSFVFNGNYNESVAARWSTGDVDFNGVHSINDSFIFNGHYNETLPIL